MIEFIVREGWFVARFLVNLVAFVSCAALSHLFCIVGNFASSALSFLTPTSSLVDHGGGEQSPTLSASYSPETNALLQEQYTLRQEQSAHLPPTASSSSSSSSSAPATSAYFLYSPHFWILLLLFVYTWWWHMQVNYAHFARGSFPYCLSIGRGHDAVELVKFIPRECRAKAGRVWRVVAQPGWHPRLLVRSTPYRDGRKIFILRAGDLVERVPLPPATAMTTTSSLPASPNSNSGASSTPGAGAPAASKGKDSSPPRSPHATRVLFQEPRDFRYTSLGWVRRSFSGLTFLEPLAIFATGELGAWKPGAALWSGYASSEAASTTTTASPISPSSTIVNSSKAGAAAASGSSAAAAATAVSGMGAPQKSGGSDAPTMGSRQNSPGGAGAEDASEDAKRQLHQLPFPARVPSTEELIIHFCFSDGAAADEQEDVVVH